MIFSISAVDLVNILFTAAGIGVCVLCILQITASRHLRKEVRGYFQLFFLLILLYISAHLARQIMDGQPGGGIRAALYVVTFIEMMAAGFMAYLMSRLVLAVAKTAKAEKVFSTILTALLILHAALICAGGFTDLIYTFDAGNAYHRAPGYLFSNLAPFLMLGVDVVLLIRYAANIDRRVRGAFWIYMIAPITAILIQSLFYGVQFIIFATVGAAVYMFSVIVKKQNEQYEKQQRENSRIETELSMASGIQSDMLPNIFPAFPERPEFDIYASMDPAREVGGDFYDFFLVDDDHLCMIVADVSGKGVPAALFMMASKIILANNAMAGKSPAQILTDTNAAVCANNREEMFVTVWIGILELSTGKLRTANAGHEYPALKHPDGSFELVKEKHDFVIGGMEGTRYREHEWQLEPGSKLFLYTDGVPEATDADGNLFGTERMLDALNASPDASPDELNKTVRSRVDGFVKDAEQFDDLTMLCVEYRGH
ncbi:MAG: PP2C family protein-serine/threonine phosphatase [Clostridia bacterium]|nr:PP2C family protein-serine/threonine phosphatase [Clostridia bacterium]